MKVQQIRSVIGNAAKITIGDPFFLILHLTILLLIAILGAIPGFTYGEHLRLLRDQVLASIFMINCLGVTFGLIRSVTDDIRRGAVSVLMSRPIGSFSVVTGKWAGVILSIIILHFSGFIGYLWISEITFDPDHLNMGSLILYLSVIVIALNIAALRHFLFGGSYAFHANYILAGILTFTFIIRLSTQNISNYDFQSIQSSIILFGGIITFSAVMLPISVTADSAFVLSAGIAIFFFGLISEYIITIAIKQDIINTIIKSIVPNWQIYWVADRLVEGQSIPLDYFYICSLHTLLFFVFYLIIATFLYERMEMHGTTL